MAEKTEKTSELKESFFLGLDVAKHLFLEGREKVASGLYTAADAVDLNAEQKSFVNEVHQKLDAKAKARKRAKELKVATA